MRSFPLPPEPLPVPQRQSYLLAFLAAEIVVSAFLLLPNLPCPLQPPLLVLWLVGALLLESASLPIPHFGRFCTTTVWTVGCLGEVDHSPVLVTLALSGWWLGTILWGLLSKRRDWPFRLAEWGAVLGLLPAFLLVRQVYSGPWSGLVGWLISGLVYVLLYHKLHATLAQALVGPLFSRWLRLEAILSPMRGLALCTAIGFLYLGEAQWPVRALLQLALYGFHLGAQNLIEVVRAQDAFLEVMRSEDCLRAALADKDQARREVQAGAQEKALLQQLTERLSALTRLDQLAPLLAGLLGPNLSLNSVAFFWSPSGAYEDLEVLYVESPERSSLQNFRLLGLGERQLRQVLLDQVARSANPPLLEEEPQGLLVPLGQGLFYLGRRPKPWSEQELRWLGWVMSRTQPFVESLRSREQQQQQLVQVHSQAQHLAARLEGQRCLLECAQRFAVHLDIESLWKDALEWLQGVLSLEGCALLWQSPARWGRPWSETALARICEGALQSKHCYYLAQSDRSRWPVDPGEFGNVLALPLPVEGVLVLAFAGAETLHSGELELLQGVANLFATALARASLHQNVLATHRRLEQSQELWLQTHKSLALAQMSAGVAHELNSPLGAIRLALESSLVQAADSQRRRLQSALDSCLRAQVIIERLAQASRQGGQAVESVDVVQAARQLLDQLTPQIRKQDIALRLESPPHLICRLPSSCLENLFVPLLLNAIEALETLEAGQRQLLVRLGKQGEEVFWEVVDNGPGFPAEVRSRLTEPFFTTKRIGKNVGLGLAMVEQTCRQVGAQLTFDSRPGVTTFKVTASAQAVSS